MPSDSAKSGKRVGGIEESQYHKRREARGTIVLEEGVGFSEDELFEWVERQAALGPRRAGSPAGIQNEDFLFSQLTAFGLKRVRREPVPVTHWNPKRSAFEVEGRLFEIFPIPYTALTREAGVEGSLVFAKGRDIIGSAKWKGRIVVAEIGFPALDAARLLGLSLGSYDPENTLTKVNHPATWIRLGWHLYKLAAKHGAVGFVGILKDQPGGTCRMYAPYGFREKDILNKPIPGLWARRDDGEALIRLARAGAKARLISTGTHESKLSHNIVGEIDGTGDEVLVLSSHHDSPFASPVEDGTGVAVVLALARHFAKRDKLKRRLVVVFTSGHFYGSIGTRTFLARHRADIVAKTALEISIEHIALEAKESGGYLVSTGLPEPTGFFISLNRPLRDAVQACVETHGLSRSLILPAEGPLGDYPPTDGGDWHKAGVPVVNAISNPVYLLTDDDALRWVDKGRLAKTASCFAELIEKVDGIARQDLARLDFPARLLGLKFLKHVVKAKTTWLGLRPTV